MNFRRCVFETDSQVLGRACKGINGRSYFATIVRDCIDLFHHFDEVVGVLHVDLRVVRPMLLQGWRILCQSLGNGS